MECTARIDYIRIVHNEAACSAIDKKTASIPTSVAVAAAVAVVYYLSISVFLLLLPQINTIHCTLIHTPTYSSTSISMHTLAHCTEQYINSNLYVSLRVNII